MNILLLNCFLPTLSLDAPGSSAPPSVGSVLAVAIVGVMISAIMFDGVTEESKMAYQFTMVCCVALAAVEADLTCTWLW